MTPATAERKLSDLSADEVRKLASEHEVEGRTNMNKAALVKALEAKGVQAPAESSSPPEPAPAAVSHSRPILAPGSAGEDVRELCRLLELLGFETSMSRGENAFAVLDASVLAAVQQFRRSSSVEEATDESALTTDEHRAAIVGPQTWEALYQAAA